MPDTVPSVFGACKNEGEPVLGVRRRPQDNEVCELTPCFATLLRSVPERRDSQRLLHFFGDGDDRYQTISFPHQVLFRNCLCTKTYLIKEISTNGTRP